MAHRVCPHWLGYFLLNPLRRLWHDPEEILRPYVTPGMTVLDLGSAMGFFTLPLAGMVGPSGRVVAVDVQEKMLRSLNRRAVQAKVAERIVARLCTPTSLDLADLEGAIDFALAFAVVHEAPDARSLFADLFRALKPGASCLVAEPKGHVSAREFAQTLSAAEGAGFGIVGTPKIARCRTAFLVK
ncbi:MAG TPA: class I SAM-dependent methyltransferase [Geobacteraceae bacterium]